MAFSLGSNGTGFGRSRFRGSSGTLSEMNVVPLVDVVLVLLIIFMLTAHVMEFGLEVNVPKVTKVKDTEENLPVVSLTKDGETYLADKPVNIHLLGESIRQRYPKSNSAFVRADKDTIWDPIAQVISALADAKIDVKLVTQPDDSAGKKR
jgi:biopolymer transport protein ExbD